MPTTTLPHRLPGHPGQATMTLAADAPSPAGGQNSEACAWAHLNTSLQSTRGTPQVALCHLDQPPRDRNPWHSRRCRSSRELSSSSHRFTQASVLLASPSSTTPRSIGSNHQLWSCTARCIVLLASNFSASLVPSCNPLRDFTRSRAFHPQVYEREWRKYSFQSKHSRMPGISGGTVSFL
jgi:hypothetical protein